MDHQQRATTAVVDTAARDLNPATLALRMQRLGYLGYIDHETTMNATNAAILT
jgi:hypothetical protein